MESLNHIKFFIFFVLITQIDFSYCQNFDTNKSNTEIKYLLTNADSLFQASNYKDAILQYKILLEYYGKSEKWEDLVKIDLKLAQSYQTSGLFDSSFYYLSVSDGLIRKYGIKDENLVGTYYYLKGITHNKTGELDSSLLSLNQSLQYFIEGVNDSLLVLVKRSIGNIYFSNGNEELALTFYKDALKKERLRSRPSEIMLAALFQNIGIVFTVTGNYDSASFYLSKSITLKERTLNKTDPQLAIGYINYGRFLYVMGNPDQALQYYTKAEEIYYLNFGTDYFNLAPIYYNKGSIFIILRDLNKALDYHERALNLYVKNTNQNNPIIGDLLMNLGVIYEKKGDLNTAIYYYNKGLEGNYNSESVVKSLRNLGRCYYNLKDSTEAEKNFKLSITKAEKFFGPIHTNTAGSYRHMEIFAFLSKIIKRRRNS